MGFSNLSVATKLWLSVALVLVGLGGSVVFLTLRAGELNRAAELVSQDASVRIKAATGWAAMTESNAVRTKALIMTSDPVQQKSLAAEIKETSAKISELQKSLEALELDAVEKAQFSKIADMRKAMLEQRNLAQKAKADGNLEQAISLVNQGYEPASKAYLAALRELGTVEESLQEQRLHHLANERKKGLTAVVVIIALVLGMLLVGTAVLVRSIRDPLREANEFAARIAQGDLSSSVNTSRKDEFGQLLRSLALMNESLSSMVAQVRTSTDNIATASAEIAQGNNDLAQRTEQTSSNLQSTASSMDSLTTTVQHSASNARQAAELAGSASMVAQRGGAVVKQVVSTMQEIDASSKKIADIISVIDGIAFQTNILALNAAVEAARAGEQGRGFAVVASEVRSLAGRSAEAAREIKALITTSVGNVESGTRLVSDAGNTMDDIVQSVRRVADVITEITAAADEQSAGIAGVNQSIADLDQMTQQNAALVEESAAAAESLREQASNMKQAVSVFKLA